MIMKRVMGVVLFIAAITVLCLYNGKVSAGEGLPYGGDIIYTKPLKAVVFSHKVHVGDVGLGCDMCHSGLFEPTALKAQEKGDFTMDSLYKGKYCGACHDGKAAFASNTQCARCHIGVKGFDEAGKKGKETTTGIQGPKEVITLGAGASAVPFSHQSHARMNKCGDCHSALFPMKKGTTKVTMDALYQGKLCGSCHNGKTAFSSNDCARCHSKMPAPKTDLVYKVKDFGPVKFSHEFHTKAFECKECHTKLFAMKKTQGKMTMDMINKGKSCGACHDGKKASSASDCGKCHIN
jgi:c(7)-type cytochrome triheme protein